MTLEQSQVSHMSFEGILSIINITNKNKDEHLIFTQV